MQNIQDLHVFYSKSRLKRTLLNGIDRYRKMTN